MTLGHRSLLCASAFALSLLAGTRNITDTDLYRFKWIADPQISPDGSQIAYVLVTVADKHDNYNTALWIVPSSGGSPRQLRAGSAGPATDRASSSSLTATSSRTMSRRVRKSSPFRGRAGKSRRWLASMARLVAYPSTHPARGSPSSPRKPESPSAPTRSPTF